MSFLWWDCGVLSTPGKEACLPIQGRDFFLPQKSLMRGGVCLPLAKAGPSLEQQEGGQAGGGTHISINLPKAI